jgi:aldehyde:ferredoxin oxidoreductase
VKEATQGIRSELGDGDVSVACIGQAGENLVSYASVTVTEERSAGRTGAGCVFGSKNLKAIAARGSRGIPVYDPKGFLAAVDEIYRRLKSDPTHCGFRKNGTLGVVGFYDRIGGNAYRNNQFSRVPSEKIKTMLARWFADNMKTHDFSCSTGCTMGCCQICEVKGDESPLAARYKGMAGEGPEYFTVATFGMGCDIPDYAAITHFHHACNDYGMDLGEIGGAVPFLMELWERGIIDEEDTKRWCGEPLRFEWGNVEAVEKTIEAVALQNNQLGRMLGGGLLKAAQAIMEEKDVPVQQYVIHGKGGSTFHEEIRSFPVWAINFAVASRGCDHLKGLNMLDKAFREDISKAWFGSTKAGEGYTPDLKGKGAARSENYTTAINNTGVCVFRTALNPLNIDLDLFARTYTALTGIELTGDELYASGERTYNLEKAFNSRLGLRRKDDTLCQRWMKEPIKEGPGKGMKAEDWFDRLLDEYYDYHGWDKKTSLPTRAKLEALELYDVLEVLEKEGAVAG